MNSNYVEKTPLTSYTTVIFAGILASSSLLYNKFDESSNKSFINNSLNSTGSISQTFNPKLDINSKIYKLSEDEKFHKVVTDFFEKLSSKQEPLGSEFEKVLFENLWDLYQS